MRKLTLVGAALGLWAVAASPEPAWAEALGVPWLGSADAAVIQSILEYEVTGVDRALPESGATFTITRTDLSDGICRSFVVEQAEAVAEGIACRAASGGWSAQNAGVDALSAAGPAAGVSAISTGGPPSALGRPLLRVQVARNPETGEVRSVTSRVIADAASASRADLPTNLADWNPVITVVTPPTPPARQSAPQNPAPRAIGLADLVEHAVPAVGGGDEPLVPTPPSPPAQ